MGSAKTITGMLALLSLASAVSAQAKPQLAGKWQLDEARTKAANLSGWAEGVSQPGMITLAVADNVFTRTTASANGAQVFSVKLDGTEQRLPYPEPKGAVTAKWEGSKVVVVTIRYLETGPARSTVEYALDGETLVVSATAPPRAGGNPVTNKLYYKRAS